MDSVEVGARYSPSRLWVLPILALATTCLGIILHVRNPDGAGIFIASSGTVLAFLCPFGPSKIEEASSRATIEEVLLWTRARSFGAHAALALAGLGLLLLALWGDLAGWSPVTGDDWGLFIFLLATVQAGLPSLRVAATEPLKRLRGRVAARTQGRTN